MNIYELIDLIFNNLIEIKDLDFFIELMPHIDTSSIAHLKPIIQEVINFYNLNNRYPDFTYIKNLSGDLIRETDKEFSNDFLVTVLNIVKQEAKKQKAIDAIMKNDENKAIQILQSATTHKAEPITGIDTFYEEYKINKLRPPGLKIGIPEVDQIYRSCSRSTVTVILAPPKNGKTTLGVSSLYYNLMNEPLNLIYILLEGSVTELKANIISAHSKKIGKPLTAFAIKMYELSEKEELVLQEVIADFEKNRKGNYALIGTRNLPEITPNTMTRVIRDIKESWKGKLDGIYTDYIQEFKYYRIPGISEEKAVINFWIRYWHDICIVEDFSKIILAQINREGERIMYEKGIVTSKAMADANELERIGGRVFALQSSISMQMSKIMKIYFIYHRYGPQPLDPIECYADFAHFQVGEDSFSSIRTLENVEGNLGLFT